MPRRTKPCALLVFLRDNEPWLPGLTEGTAGLHAGAMDTLNRLEAVIAQRSNSDPATSYVAKLNAKGVAAIAQKVGEEATETVIAALTGEQGDLVAESADLVFHLLVLLQARDVPLAEVLAELDRRHGVSGLDEKASRTPEES